MASHLARDSLGLATLVPSRVLLHQGCGETGQHHGRTDCSGVPLGAFDTQTNTSTVISNGDKCLEPDLLASMSLLSHGYNLQNIILEGRPQGQKPRISASLMGRQK